MGALEAVGTRNSVMAPAGVIRPILLPESSVNQRLPSGPAVMLSGALPVVGTANSVTVPVRVIRPILFPLSSVNQTFPSWPAVMPMGPLPAVGTVNSVTAPAGVIRPIRLPKNSVNQRLPSGPAVMLRTLLAAVVIGNSVIVTAATGDTSRATSIRASAVPVLTVLVLMKGSFANQSGCSAPRGDEGRTSLSGREVSFAIDVPDRIR